MLGWFKLVAHGRSGAGGMDLRYTPAWTALFQIGMVLGSPMERAGSSADVTAEVSPEGLRKAIGPVLVIDDSEIARAAMVEALVHGGLDVIELRSPIGATRAILVHNVSVVVVDVMMPGMRGDRLTTLFRSNPRFQTLAVVLVSDQAQGKLESLLRESGADAVVSKSNLSELLPAVVSTHRKRTLDHG